MSLSLPSSQPIDFLPMDRANRAFLNLMAKKWGSLELGLLILVLAWEWV